MSTFPTSLDGEYAGGSKREPICQCFFCDDIFREEDAYEPHGVTACPTCDRLMPDAILSVDEKSRTAVVDAWAAKTDKELAESLCEAWGLKVSHGMSEEAQKAMMAEIDAMPPEKCADDLAGTLWQIGVAGVKASGL